MVVEGVSIEWRGDELLKVLASEMEKRLAVVGEATRSLRRKKFPPASAPYAVPAWRTANSTAEANTGPPILAGLLAHRLRDAIIWHCHAAIRLVKMSQIGRLVGIKAGRNSALSYSSGVELPT